MNMATEYGSRLAKARKHAKLTQMQLSAKTGIAQSTIFTAEREGYGSTLPNSHLRVVFLRLLVATDRLVINILHLF